MCKVCGLPKELCVCQEIAREQQRINVFSEKRKFGKVVTVIEGLDEKQLNLKELTKSLKEKLACGGTAKDGRIELQGDHKSRVKDVLVVMGFSPEMVDVR
ncbi:MAG: stress response translation initiation inhibitor YciH [Candidatus Hodarchaeaceae archaeon]|nr:stress response translation initiation inhibitor YciH [Candidatus Hodarchaeaceae archaeon]